MMQRLAFPLLALAILAAGLAPIDLDALPVSDKALHALAFVVFAVSARGSGWSFGLSLVTAAIFAAILELAQGMTGTRTASIFDWIFSVGGACLGAAIARARPGRSRYVALVTSLACVVLADTTVAEARGAITATLLNRAWTQAEAKGAPVAPWPGSPAHVTMKLHVLGEDVEVVDSTTRAALAIAPGLWNADTDPEQNLIVLGHRNRVFRVLRDIRVGDSVAIRTASQQALDYDVTSIEVVQWNRSGVFPDHPANTLTLVTCWPVNSSAPSDLRLVVRAIRKGVRDPQVSRLAGQRRQTL